MIASVIEIVRRAGAAARDTHAALREALFLSEKNLATAGANAVERVLRRRLLALHPAAWISPASGAAEMSEDAWVITPLTGSRDYARGKREYGVAVGLLRRGDMLLSVVYSPDTGALYAAEKGSGAWTGDGRRCFVADAGDDVSIVSAAVALPLTLARVASGEAAVLLSREHFPVWDVAAGALLVTEAGGTVVDGRRHPLRFIHSSQHVHGLRAGTSIHVVSAPMAPYGTNICNV
jgi:myo-inositol-1(or 4)-monophosphatase